MSGKVLPRLCVFFIGVPLILGLVMLPQYNHLAILLLITAISFIAATELFHIFSHNFVLKNKWLIVTLTTLIPLTFVFRAFFQFDFKYITYAYIFVILLFLIWEVFSNFKAASLIRRLCSFPSPAIRQSYAPSTS